MSDSRRFAPATARNREPIRAVLTDVLPRVGRVLEIASGTGEHAVHLARHFPALDFQPSDPDADGRTSIAAWRAHAALPNLAEPLDLDVSQPACWATVSGRVDAILCINMIHISPWSATEGLMSGAASLLAPGAPLYLYGPYRRADHDTAPSNAAFDQSLRTRDPAWGLRALEDVEACAAAHGFGPATVIEMPANNLSVILHR